ncbi:MAG TPA: GNAT family N-acetyltransferase [Propionibacteriaceae bacterium]|nr:GNAT family N-acetyltransferase [Propionibacteriaceae bacterium]
MTPTNLPGIVVRPVIKADLAALIALEQHPDAHISEGRFAEMAKGDNTYFIAVKDDVVLGTAVLDLRDPDMLPELRDMYVYPHARRQGVGHALTEHIEAEARELGYEEIFLGVDPDNFEAIPLYISLGYEPTGNHRLLESTDDEGDSPTGVHHDAIYRKGLRYAK